MQTKIIVSPYLIDYSFLATKIIVSFYVLGNCLSANKNCQFGLLREPSFWRYSSGMPIFRYFIARNLYVNILYFLLFHLPPSELSVSFCDHFL